MHTGSLDILPSFTKEEFLLWKLLLETNLMSKEIYESIMSNPSSSKNAEALAKWKKNDCYTRATILHSLNYKQMCIVQKCDSARQMIKALESAFEFSSSKSLFIWMEKLTGLRLNSKDEYEEHKDALLHILSKLEMCKMELSDSQKIAHLFGTLGPTFGPFKSIVNVRQITFDEALNCLREECVLQSTAGGSNEHFGATYTKAVRPSFHSNPEKRSTKVSDLVHTDLCGPISVPSLANNRYILILVDDFSRYNVIYLIRKKSQTHKFLKKYIAMVNNRFGTKSKAILSDNEREQTTEVSEDSIPIEGDAVTSSNDEVSDEGLEQAAMQEIAHEPEELAVPEESEPANWNAVEQITAVESIKWKNAAKEEMEALRKNRTWTVTKLPPDKKAIRCKWTFKLKKDANGRVKCHKARLVAKEYLQKYGEDYDQTFAPVVQHSTVRMLLSIAACRKMQVRHLDIKTAFLYGEISEELYMEQPPGFVDKEHPGMNVLQDWSGG
ncbi:hypothetical protein JRQ81_019503 [Phrynocephalus forsythii]|uniref:Integrase catalytic domain-containing protein n=1 Tax=Phrynocephalus forsythii TaxID=171643 RepID=A0A9Q0XN30_9SAUR|nr:hypothetical protein JRQ81_019503 [Phrynocephalus forsythii]